MPGEDVLSVLDPDTLVVEGTVQLDCEGGKGKEGSEENGAVLWIVKYCALVVHLLPLLPLSSPSSPSSPPPPSSPLLPFLPLLPSIPFLPLLLFLPLLPSLPSLSLYLAADSLGPHALLSFGNHLAQILAKKDVCLLTHTSAPAA